MSITAFFSQGGYGGYVWGAYGVAVVLLAGEVLQLRSRRRAVIARIRRIARLREQEVNRTS